LTSIFFIASDPNDFSNSLSWNSISETTDKTKGSGFIMKGLGEATNFVFAGKPNNGTIKLALDENNYYLVGNPYPSEINADNFITDGAIYYWDQSTGASQNKASYEGGHATRIAGVGVPASSIVVDGSTIDFIKTPNEFISIEQGFMVVGITDGKEMTFKNSFRDNSEAALFFKSASKAKVAENSPIKLI
jgi:hypothetical protein